MVLLWLFDGDILSLKHQRIFSFLLKHGYLQHSKDKYKFQTFLSRILGAGLSSMESEFVSNLEKNGENPAIRRPRINPVIAESFHVCRIVRTTILRCIKCPCIKSINFLCLQIINLFLFLKITILCFRYPGAEAIKLFSMLNSAEHEIYPTHKCKNANNCWHFNIY